MLPDTWGADAALKAYPYDPARAKKLLAEAGYPNGFTTTLWVPESGSGMQAPVAMSTVIQSNLKAVGVNVALQTMEWGAYLAKLRSKEQELFALSWMAGTEDPDMVMYPLLHSCQWTPNGPNRALYKNEKFDELLSQARQVTDQAKRAALYQRGAEDPRRGRAVDLRRPRDPDRRDVQARAGLQAPPELRPPRRDDLAEVRGGLVAASSLRRLLLLVPVLMGVSVIVFLVLHLTPGDPAEIMLGSQATQEDLARLRAELGLDEPLHVQYAAGSPRRAGRSRPLALDAAAGARRGARPVQGHPDPHGDRARALDVGGVALGHPPPRGANSWLDRASAVASLFGASMPVFWLGIVLMVIFSLTLGWLPASGMYAPYGGGDPGTCSPTSCCRRSRSRRRR